jgi:hypothetical protein
LDAALARAPEPVRAQFRALLAERVHSRGGADASTHDIGDLTSWLASTNTSDEAIDHISQVTVALAEAHSKVAPTKILDEAIQLHQRTQAVLQSGKQRLRQTRDLLRIDGELLAHASLLLSDLNEHRAAEKYGNAALLCLREADANQFPALYVLAKTARWQGRYAEAADLGRRGVECSSLDPMRVQLACYEANAAALLGDSSRARKALTRAEEAAAALPEDHNTLSPWSFPPERMAIFRLSVALHTYDPDGALQAAAVIDETWLSGEPHIPAAWAQIRIGAGIAHLMKDSLDGVAEEVAPVLALAPEFRIGTVTGWLTDLDRRLSQRRFAGSRISGDLRQRIADFNSVALLVSAWGAR